MYLLHTYEYGALKPVKLISRRRKGKSENKGGINQTRVILHMYENGIMNPPHTVIIY
jgi:hypothetical protein